MCKERTQGLGLIYGQVEEVKPKKELEGGGWEAKVCEGCID